jgi:hypothetical protein
VALERGQQPLAVGRIARFDDEVEDQAASAGGQVELVAVRVLAALADDVGMGFEQLTSFSRAGTGSPARTRRSVWVMIRSISG